jgi:hypothetical protein
VRGGAAKKRHLWNVTQMAANLAPIFLDNERVRLQGDPRPRLGKILAWGGRSPDEYYIVRLREPLDPQGRPIAADECIDRSFIVTQPIYLRSFKKKWRRR